VKIHPLVTNKFNYLGEGRGEGGIRRRFQKKEEELKEQIDMKISTKFQINPSTNGRENYNCTIVQLQFVYTKEPIHGNVLPQTAQVS
jgi:hypothetical protein